MREQYSHPQNGRRYLSQPYSRDPGSNRPSRPPYPSSEQQARSSRPPQGRTPQGRVPQGRNPQGRVPQGRPPQGRSGVRDPYRDPYDDIQMADGSYYNGRRPTMNGGYRPEPQTKRNTGKRVFWSILLILAALSVIAFILINGLINRIEYEEPNKDVYQPDVKTSASSAAKSIPLSRSSQVTNILLLGSDSGAGGRSDTNLLLSIDKKNKKIKMTSFLRDLYVEIPGYTTARINAAFNHGGPDKVIQTIEANFRIKIDAYFRLDFGRMSKMVNSIGGIECELTKAEAKYITQKTGIKTPEGISRLYGFQSLWYCRIRKLDSDFGRTSRQRNFINFMIKDFKSRSLSKKYSFMYDMLPYLITREDLRDDMWKYIILAVKAINYETEELTVPIDGGYASKTINGAAVLVPDIPKNCEAIKNFIYSDK